MTRLHARLRRLLVPAVGEGVVAAAPPVPLREIFRRFWPYLTPYRGRLAVVLGLIALGPAIQTVEIWLFKVVVDNVLVPADFAAFPPLASAFVGLALLAAVVSFCDDYLSTWIGERFLLTLRVSFFRHLQHLSLDFFEGRRLGDVVTRLTGDVAAVESLVLGGVSGSLAYVLRIVFFSAALFYLSWQLAVVSLVVAPLFWVAARRFSRLIKAASREKRRRSGSLGAVAEESLANAALVQAYNRQETEVERFQRENVGSFEAELAATRLKALFSPVVDLIDLAGAMLVIGFGTWQLSQGRLSVGGLLAFLAYLSQLYSPIRGLSRLTGTIYSASAAAERIVEFLDQEPAVRERPDARPLRRPVGVVEFDRVGFAYPGAARTALDDLSFAVGPGEMVALVGASGGGKTTAAKLLLRFYDPARGRILLDGHDLRTLRLDDLRNAIALLLQETLVFDGAVAENIAYGRPDATRADVVRAARAADAHEFVSSLPEGYETTVGQRGRRLSGGQRQRIAIARALVRDAPVLVLDEPTTGLDAESSRRILEPLQRLMSGRATIVVSHNLLTVHEATEIVVLDDGRVVERGTHEQLLDARGAYARLSGLHGVERSAVA